jgi:hypothetical protein
MAQSGSRKGPHFETEQPQIIIMIIIIIIIIPSLFVSLRYLCKLLPVAAE